MRYLVVRVPDFGPKAIISAPNDFASREEAALRITRIEAEQKMTHHTHLEIEAYSGDRLRFCDVEGILY